jgi:ureidoacrylate peracid hydrolase
VFREPLLDLGAKVRPAHTALVIVDVQNDFCADDGMMAEQGVDLGHVQAMVPTLRTLLESARAAGVLPVFVRSVYSTAPNWYLSDVTLELASRRQGGERFTRKPACPPDSWNSDFFGDIRPLPTEPVVTKHRYSAFYNTDLDLILRSHGIRTLIVTGVATNVCVETTVREGFIRDYYIVLPEDGAAAYSLPDHEASLRTIGLHFGQVVPVERIVAEWAVPDGQGSPRRGAHGRAPG